MSALLAAAGALLVAAALWQIAGERGEDTSRSIGRRLRRHARRTGGPLDPGTLLGSLEGRIEAAALEARISPAAVLAAKVASAFLSLPAALAAAPVAPGRLGSIVLVGVPAAAFLAPDLMLERAARMRRARVAAALPEALDLMAYAGGSVLKRVAPIVGAIVLGAIVFVVVRRLRG